MNNIRCGFLKSRSEVEACTKFLHENGYASHALTCKDWDIAQIIPQINDGNFLDMGSSGSYILKNVLLKNIRGEKYGIDLRAPDLPLPNVKYLVGDLLSVPIDDGFFDYIACLSVIEHEVDLDKFAKEASRLLRSGGKIFVTFDYWDPQVKPRRTLYSLKWQPLDKKHVKHLVKVCAKSGLKLVEKINWDTEDTVINKAYYSPEPKIQYTFGLITLVKS